MMRYKSKKTGTIDVREPSPVGPPHLLGKSPDEITAYVLGGIVKGKPKAKAAPRPGGRARSVAAKELVKAMKKGARGYNIHSLRKELTKDDDGGDIVL